jgi:hypothetical protein
MLAGEDQNQRANDRIQESGRVEGRFVGSMKRVANQAEEVGTQDADNRSLDHAQMNTRDNMSIGPGGQEANDQPNEKHADKVQHL